MLDITLCQVYLAPLPEGLGEADIAYLGLKRDTEPATTTGTGVVQPDPVHKAYRALMPPSGSASYELCGGSGCTTREQDPQLWASSCAQSRQPGEAT